MTLGMQVGLIPGHIVLDGDPVAPSPKRAGPGHIVLDGDPVPPSPKRGTAPQFSAHVYCGQTAGWIKMALGMEVCLGPGDFVLDWDPAPPPAKGA